MKSRLEIIVLSVIALTTPALAPALQAEPFCIADWSEARPIVRREGLASMERVGRLARDRGTLEIIGSSLCRADGDRYVYRLTVRSGEGVLRTLVVDARHPFDP